MPGNGHQGVLNKYTSSRDAEAYPLNIHVVRGGGSLRPLLQPGAVSPSNVPEKKREEGVRARHGLWAPCQRVIVEPEEGWGTWERLPRAYLVYTPFWP